MNIYILTNHIMSLFVSTSMLTTLSFDSEVLSYIYGGSTREIRLDLTPNKKTLILKPLKSIKSTNLLIVTKNREYYFKVINNENTHSFLKIKHGMINNTFKEYKRFSDFTLLEGNTSYMVLTKKSDLKIGDVLINKKGYLSKGIPLIYKNKRILH